MRFSKVFGYMSLFLSFCLLIGLKSFDNRKYENKNTNSNSKENRINENAKFLKSFQEQNILENVIAKDKVWQSIGGLRFKFFVLSAYYDWREVNRMVRVIGATIKFFNSLPIESKTRCLLWYKLPNNTYMFKNVPGRVSVIDDRRLLAYSACYVICPLKHLEAPHSVTIIFGKLGVDKIDNRVLVNHAYPGLRPELTPPPDKLAVCLPPFPSNYQKPLQMLEFIEMNTLLGVNHFIFYNESLSSTIGCILNHYVQEGRAIVNPWELDLPIKPEGKPGVLAAVNDCIYQTMYKFRYLSIIDVDEIIMPTSNDTIQQFIEWTGTRMNASSIGSYSFRNGFFYLQWPDDLTLSDDPFETRLTTLRKTRRVRNVPQTYDRSRYVCRPEVIIEADTHYIWSIVSGYTLSSVEPRYGIVNIYLNSDYEGNVKSESIIDRTAHRYKTRLLERVKAKWTELETECSLPNIEDI